MSADVDRLIAVIDGLSSVDTADDLSRLQELADQYFTYASAAEHLGVWFRLYERFPVDDGHGVFWTILHGIEAQPGYERLVIESIRRRPSRFPVLMINRLLNAGVKQVGGMGLLELLDQVAADEHCPRSVRDEAESLIRFQRSGA